MKEFLNNKSVKPKEKAATLSAWLLENKINPNDLIAFAGTANETLKATCIEALEFATKQNPAIANDKCFQFVANCLSDKAPRIKWESAKVVGNIRITCDDGTVIPGKRIGFAANCCDQ
ncbi:MAG: hypothetical protein IPJ82_16300 [Lewinellaceae bacterium]|nr:hypothetical protein [Lewinellaceae bacterium]